MSSQILILKQLFSFSFSTVNVLSIQSFKPHTCPTTVVPLHVASNSKKDHGYFVCHNDKPVLLLLHLTTPSCKCGNLFNCELNPRLQIL